MKKLALIKSGVVENIALWDGSTSYDPVSAGLCDISVDVTDLSVKIGDTYANGEFTSTPYPIIPDPQAFMASVFADGSIPITTRLQLVPWKTAISDNLDNEAVITAAWDDLVTALSISTDNQTTIHNYAVAFGIPGI